MRPLKLGPISFVSHTFIRNNTYYYRANVPVDLLQYFPTTEIKKSLKTKESKAAKLVAISFEYKIQQAFAMLRTGMLPDDIIQQLVNGIVPTKQKAAVVRGRLLSEAIRQYVAEKESGWTAKSKMEFNSVFKLLLDVLEDVEVASISKPMVTELRSTLQKLPPNIYKKYPDKTIKQVLAENDVEPMSTKSVNKHVSRLGALLIYCVDEGMISTNPASGLKISEKKRADEERSAYAIPSDDILKAIINAVKKLELESDLDD